MSFLAPTMLWSLLAVPLLILVYIWLQRRRKKYAVRLGSLLLMKQALKRGPGWQRHVPPLLFLLALAALLLALARPVTQVTLPTREGTVILLMDVSGSMQATDIEPTRMEAAKAAARAFVDKQPAGVRIGVVSFSDNASIVQAPTSNRDDVIAAINRLRQQRATAIGRGLLTSLDAIFSGDSAEEAAISPYQFPQGRQSFGQQFGQQPFGQQQQQPRGFGGRPTPEPPPTMTPVPKGTYEPAIIVLLTDGENNQYPPPLDIIDQVVDRGVRVFTVGLGSNQGIVVSNQGRSMRTRLDEATLQKIAEQTDGEYYSASNAQDLRTIYEHLGLELVMRTEKEEITWGLAGISILVLVLAGTLSLIWFNRVL